MRDREHVHPLLLSAAIACGGDAYHEWSEAGQPILSARCSAVMAAVEEDMSGMCADCPCESCEGCANAWMLADAVRAAWKETK